jgi:phosphoribosylformylglycinamidine synthase
MFLARIFISLKPTVNDPEGLTIQGGLNDLGFHSVQSVRASKYMEVRLDEATEESARAAVRGMCDKLLANPVIEEYRFELERADES